MAEACRALDFPVVSGNVSLYNETEGKSDPADAGDRRPGRAGRMRRRRSASRCAPGLDLVLLGATAGHLGQSLWLREMAGQEEGPPPPVDLAAERRNGDFVRARILAGTVAACHDVSDGGLLVAVAEMALAGDVGARLLPGPDGHRAACILVRRGPGALRAGGRRCGGADRGGGGGGGAGAAAGRGRRSGFDTAGGCHHIPGCSAPHARAVPARLDGGSNAWRWRRARSRR